MLVTTALLCVSAQEPLTRGLGTYTRPVENMRETPIFFLLDIRNRHILVKGSTNMIVSEVTLNAAVQISMLLAQIQRPGIFPFQILARGEHCQTSRQNSIM